MNPVIERAARALTVASTGDDSLWDAYVPEVLAVLRAIREPDEGMTSVVVGGARGEMGSGDARFVWQAMIDQLIASAPQD